jgi:hypothetical protein
MIYSNIFVYFTMAQKVVVVPQTILEVFEICVPLIRLATSRFKDLVVWWLGIEKPRYMESKRHIGEFLF